MPGGTKRKLSYSGALGEAPSKKAKGASKKKNPEVTEKTSTAAKLVKKSNQAKACVVKTAQPKKDSKKKTTSVKTVKAKSTKDVPDKKKPKQSYTKQISKDSIEDAENCEEIEITARPATKNKKGQYEFDDWKEFRPNMSPKEVLQAGSFGGTYFRPIHSSITKQKYSGAWKELPKDWLEGLNVGKQVSSSSYDIQVNTYKAKCGGSLEMWESSGWMHPQDPYGWFQWYCRFFQGRRSEDDERQVGRWLRCAGIKGRWRNNLIAKCVRSGCAFDNPAVSPVVRQTLQHWGYKLNKEDHDAYAKKVK